MKIINKKILAQMQGIRIVELEILAVDIARKAQAGQFVALMVKEEGERIPLTIVSRDLSKGSIILIFQEVGFTTKLLGSLNPGDSLFALVGPLGSPTEIKNYGKVILVGGGVGIAEVYSVAKALKEAGNYIVTILGTKSKDLMFLEKELKEISDELYITTDDGSYGRKGFATDVLIGLLKKDKYDMVYAVGPIPMMKQAVLVAKDYNVKITVSLNPIMVDATGMCGCCRVEVAGKTKFSCVDGPEFDGQDVDWDGLIKRNNIYIEQERHICNLFVKKSQQ